ncbi:catalase [Nocardioides sp.]|jgi:catalase|uniref:catalase n=1 Tax=Nocardioides sp. TaxID=35761 RepID=UPI002D120788|nr:catalase [Nocardioides sp.]HVX53895.1 catalase [Nocardioides sp.]
MPDKSHAVPGAPAPEPPTLEEPTTPREPLEPKADQTGPDVRTPSGAVANEDQAVNAQQGEWLTTSVGARLRDTDHSLKAGERGPTLLQDHHLREKITHFDHERIPERVVHARGAAAHGVFTGYGTAAEVTCAAFLDKDVQTPVFTRFSTVLGSRGSADTVRDTRGFATKFYTAEGIFDLVGNNIPVFFIQDGIKFPDIIHAGKPHPDREIPQAQSAHDTFWDFVSLHTEAQAHTMWNMSDRGIPRSFRMMEGFGIHTFRMINAAGETSLVKFHWKPRLGVHAQTWEEAQLTCGFDPDFHRRDLADAIEAGAYPEWELGIQVFPDEPDQMFAGIDLLDPTKIVPEELAPVQPIGLLQLNRNPSNYFAETEQVAFHPGNLVRGIDVTDDALLQARLFSYIDTQLTRLGGPNFNQIPINRPHAPVNDMLRDGFHQDAVHRGVAPYRPNSLDGGCPFHASGADDRAFVEAPVEVAAAPKTRAQAASFDDHFSQVRLFWRSMTPIEQDHIVLAYSFELGKCYEQTIKERQLQCLANIDAELCSRVAANLGLPAPAASESVPDADPSPALSMVGESWPVDGRVIGVVTCPDCPQDEVAAIRQAIFDAGMVPLLIGPTGGQLPSGIPLQRSFDTARSIEYDAVLLAGGIAAHADDPRVTLLVQEVFRQAKAIGAWGDGDAALTAAAVDAAAPGVVVGDSGEQVLTELAGLLAKHRAWERVG